MKILDLLEAHEIRQGLKYTLPPTYTMPQLNNGDAYRQYRHTVAMAGALSQDDKSHDHSMEDRSAWGQSQTVVCYTPAEYEILLLANRIMGVNNIPLTASPSEEAPWRGIESPVRPFVDLCESTQDQAHEHGTIVKLIPDASSSAWIQKWAIRNGIDCIDPRDMHCTILFSRQPVSRLARLDGRPLGVTARPIGLKKLGKALTIELHCPAASRLHKWMIEQGGSHDYPEFIPHLTLSYDWDQKSLPSINLPQDTVLRFNILRAGPINPDYVEEISRKS